MVDPLQAVLGAVTGQAMARAFTAVLGPDGARIVSISPESNLVALVTPGSDEVIGILTESQLGDIEDFLESDEVATLLQAWCVCELLGRSGESLDFADRLIPDTFGEMARRWRHNIEAQNRREKSDDWLSLWREVWLLVSNSVKSALPRLAISERQTQEISELMVRYTGGSALLRGGGDPTNIHVRDLAELLATPQRVINAPQVCGDLRTVARRKHAQLVLSHVNDEYRIDEHELYIDRFLRLLTQSSRRDLAPQGELVQSRKLSDADRIVRAVIIGDPGAGKSTLVRHFAFDLSRATTGSIAPIVVVCREYAASEFGKPILAFIADQIASGESIVVSTSQMGDLLTLGSACVIFDGIDEVLDPATRRILIDRIEAFSERYPLATIIATSRKEGYSQARFSKDFDLLELDEFSELQVEEYVRSWFRLMKRSSVEASSLLHELESLRDIRNNPLMLSLLCTLYRARGFIPRNRRDVYKDCAELLFERWDSMRHIEPPYDHKQYGQRLILELAGFYFGSQVAQAGIDEKQLAGVIAAFFRDTGGIEPPDDEKRARDFLQFCAGRAWLLTSRGTNRRGVRIFTFTHRTFMEYYASESIVRKANTVEEIATAIEDSFRRDPSSVLPDVISQAADDKIDRGAEKLLRILFAKGSKHPYEQNEQFLALCLRILNGSAMSRTTTDPLPRRILSCWIQSPKSTSASSDTARILFSLHRDARRSVLRSIARLEPLTDRQLLWNKICQQWLDLVTRESIDTVEGVWATEITNQMRLLISDSALADDLVDFATTLDLYDLSNVSDGTLKPVLITPMAGTVLSGRALQAVADILLNGRAEDSLAKAQLVQLAKQVELGATFSYSTALRSTDYLCDLIESATASQSNELVVTQDSKDLIECMPAISAISVMSWQIRAHNSFDRAVASLKLGISGTEADGLREDAVDSEIAAYVERVPARVDSRTRNIIKAWLEGRPILY